MGGSTSFSTHIAENHLGTLFELCFGRVWDQMGQKCQYFAKYDQKCIFWAKFGRFTGGSKSFGTHVTKTYLDALLAFFWSGMGSSGTEKPIFGQKCQFWGKKS